LTNRDIHSVEYRARRLGHVSAEQMLPIPAISISRSSASRSSVPGERDQWRVGCVTAPLD
jgi:hypothetical protein